jgi:adenosylhomocysteine nucleosidase
MLAFIVGLKAEAKILEPLGVRAFIGGGTAAGAAAASHRAIENGAHALVSFGLAGGLNPALEAGHLIVPAHVVLHGRQLPADEYLSTALGGINSAALVAADSVIGSVAGKAERWNDMHADAVDLESGAVAAAARRANIPFAVLRAICDPATRPLPPAAMAGLNKSGGISLVGLALSLLTNPGQISDLMALSRDAAQARQALVGRVGVLCNSADLRRWKMSAPIGF